MGKRSIAEGPPLDVHLNLHAGLSAERIRASLDRLFADPQFQLSERNRRFLRFVTEETLAGRTDRIKSYSIAVDVFGRDAGFDGSIDPIVRIEATRIRSALSAYYDGPGRGEAVRIGLPKGGYVPSFGEIEPAASSPPEAPAANLVAEPPAESEPARTIEGHGARSVFRLTDLFLLKRGRMRLAAATLLSLVALATIVLFVGKPSWPAFTTPAVVLVEGAQAATRDAETGQIATGFTELLVQSLSRFEGLRVVGLPKDLPIPSALDRLASGGVQPGATYALESSVRRDEQTLRFWWTLKDARSGETIWADKLDQSFSGGMTIPVEDAVAGRLAAVIGQPIGMVATRGMATERVYPTAGYGCVLRARAYYLAMSESLHREIRECLEQTVALSPDYSEAWSILAFVYLDEVRNKFNPRITGGDGLTRAIAAAGRAAELAPYSAEAQEALLGVYYFKGDFDTAFGAGRRAIEINPNDPQLKSSLGSRLFARGNWDEGAALVADAISHSFVASPAERGTLAMNFYRKRDYAAALEQANLMANPGYYFVPMLRAAINGQLGDAGEAEENVKALLALRPNYASEMRAELNARHYTEPMIDMLAEGLAKAGLVVK